MSCTSSNAYDVVLLLYCNMHIAALVVLSRELSVPKKFYCLSVRIALLVCHVEPLQIILEKVKYTFIHCINYCSSPCRSWLTASSLSLIFVIGELNSSKLNLLALGHMVQSARPCVMTFPVLLKSSTLPSFSLFLQKEQVSCANLSKSAVF